VTVQFYRDALGVGSGLVELHTDVAGRVVELVDLLLAGETHLPQLAGHRLDPERRALEGVLDGPDRTARRTGGGETSGLLATSVEI
jgi:hypothetical protein